MARIKALITVPCRRDDVLSCCSSVTEYRQCRICTNGQGSSSSFIMLSLIDNASAILSGPGLPLVHDGRNNL